MELKGASFQKKAFTLLELMIGVAVIAVIAAIAIPSFLKYMRDAREAELTQALYQAKRAQDIVIKTHGAPAFMFEGTGPYGDDVSYPKLDYRISSTPKFNLIIGVKNIEPALPDDDNTVKYRFDQLYPNANLPRNVNNFGRVSPDNNNSVNSNAPEAWVIGVEADFDGDNWKQVMGINQAGLLFKFCDDFSNSADPVAANMYSDFGFGDINCDSSADQNGGGNNNTGGDGAD